MPEEKLQLTVQEIPHESLRQLLTDAEPQPHVSEAETAQITSIILSLRVSLLFNPMHQSAFTLMGVSRIS